jgi:8-oxo-dGTP pyrophosphatase MutT (NUDIX family)
MLKLESNREAVTPKDAATMLVLRPTSAADAVEVFCVRRHAKSAFMGGAVVFPGGKLDTSDAGLGGAVHKRASIFAADDAHAHALAVCACRESFEEAALLPCAPPLDDVAVRALRTRLEAGEDFHDLIAEAGVELTTDALIPFARWVTPEAEQRRYDARFFLARLSEGQLGRHDAHETTMSVWSTPARLIDAFVAGDLFLAPPTLRCLELLRDVTSVDAAFALADEQSLLPICPAFVPGEPPMLVIAGDPKHEIKQRRVAGHTRFVLRDGKFVSEAATESG